MPSEQRIRNSLPGVRTSPAVRENGPRRTSLFMALRHKGETRRHPAVMQPSPRTSVNGLSHRDAANSPRNIATSGFAAARKGEVEGGGRASSKPPPPSIPPPTRLRRPSDPSHPYTRASSGPHPERLPQPTTPTPYRASTMVAKGSNGLTPPLRPASPTLRRPSREITSPSHRPPPPSQPPPPSTKPHDHSRHRISRDTPPSSRHGPSPTPPRPSPVRVNSTPRMRYSAAPITRVVFQSRTRTPSSPAPTRGGSSHRTSHPVSTPESPNSAVVPRKQHTSSHDPHTSGNNVAVSQSSRRHTHTHAPQPSLSRDSSGGGVGVSRPLSPSLRKTGSSPRPFSGHSPPALTVQLRPVGRGSRGNSGIATTTEHHTQQSSSQKNPRERSRSPHRPGTSHTHSALQATSPTTTNSTTTNSTTTNSTAHPQNGKTTSTRDVLADRNNDIHKPRKAVPLIALPTLSSGQLHTGTFGAVLAAHATGSSPTHGEGKAGGGNTHSATGHQRDVAGVPCLRLPNVSSHGRGEEGSFGRSNTEVEQFAHNFDSPSDELYHTETPRVTELRQQNSAWRAEISEKIAALDRHLSTVHSSVTSLTPRQHMTHTHTDHTHVTHHIAPPLSPGSSSSRSGNSSAFAPSPPAPARHPRMVGTRVPLLSVREMGIAQAIVREETVEGAKGVDYAEEARMFTLAVQGFQSEPVVSSWGTEDIL